VRGQGGPEVKGTGRETVLGGSLGSSRSDSVEKRGALTQGEKEQMVLGNSKRESGV